jgi:hypothetical protein
MGNLQIVQEVGSVSIFREGETAPCLVQHAHPGTRPYIHPIIAPDGQGILTEDTPSHHPWQHGLYVGLNDLNGIGYWMEGLHPDHKATDGTFHPHPISKIATDKNQATWTVVSDWNSPQGSRVLTEKQTWKITDLDASYYLDISWSLSAQIDITFGAYDYGGLFLRMPYEKDRGGEALNSEGLINKEAEGKRARWVSVSMPIEGRNNWAGISMFDHPTNPEHPNPWRVDGQLGIVPSHCLAGSWELAKNETTTHRYRLFIFCGRTKTDEIESQWERFTNG